MSHPRSRYSNLFAQLSLVCCALFALNVACSPRSRTGTDAPQQDAGNTADRNERPDRTTPTEQKPADKPTGPPCIGVRVQGSDPKNFPAKPGTIPANTPANDDCRKKPRTCVGSDAPSWVLSDFQAQSCGYKKQYGLQDFRGKATLVVLLSGW